MLQVELMAIEAGVAVVDITPEAGTFMGGYGARREGAVGVHDPLFARSLVVADGSTSLVLIVCDLVGVPRELAHRIRELVEARYGIPATNVCVSATHTHSGPGVIYSNRLAGYIAATAEKVATSVEGALRGLTPVILKLRKTKLATVSQNRRHPASPVQKKALVLVADPGPPAPPVATLIAYACHATVLEADNLLFSADFPGTAVKLVERSVGGTCLYLQGACGDINPVWMRHDFEEVARVGGILGAAAVRAAHELRPHASAQWGINLSWSEEVEQPPAPGLVLSESTLAATAAMVELEARSLPAATELERDIAGLRSDVARAQGEARRLKTARLNRLEVELLMQTYERLRPPPRQSVEVQAFRFAEDCALLALPGEFLFETDRALRKQAPFENLLLACYVNDYIGYVPPAPEFPRDGYEVGFARFAERSEAAIREAAQRLLAELYEAQR